jgi:hypothetical protein
MMQCDITVLIPLFSRTDSVGDSVDFGNKFMVLTRCG